MRKQPSNSQGLCIGNIGHKGNRVKYSLIVKKISFFIGIILELILLIRLHVRAIFILHPPPDWSIGNKGHIILIPGYSGHWSFFFSLANSLNQEGYRIHVLPEIESFFLPAEESAQRIKKYLELHNLKNTILLGHSRGGLIALLVREITSIDTIRAVIALESPFQGCWLGYFPFWILKELHPLSKTLRKVHQIKSELSNVLSIFPGPDYCVLFHKMSFLAGAQNHEVEIVGHNRLLESPVVHAKIKKFISK